MLRLGLSRTDWVEMGCAEGILPSGDGFTVRRNKPLCHISNAQWGQRDQNPHLRVRTSASYP